MDRRLPMVIVLLVAGLWGAMLAYLHLRPVPDPLERMEAALADMRSAILGFRPAPDIVTIIAIDDRTASAHGYPLDRGTLARLVASVGALQPKALALDILLVDPGPEEGDAALASALKATPSVIAGAATFPQSVQSVGDEADDPLAGIPQARQLLLPQPRFMENAAVGIVNVATDQSGVPRFVPLFSRATDRLDAAFSLRAASIALGAEPLVEKDGIRLGPHRIATDVGQRMPLSFYGPAGTIHTYSAADALDGKLPADAVKGKVAVIGVTVTGGGDVFPTPFDPILPGVEVMSTAITHLIAGDGLVRDGRTRLADAAIAVVLPVLLVALVAWRRSALGLVVIGLTVAAWAALNLAAFAGGYWLSAVLPIAAGVPPMVVVGAVELWRDRRRATHFAGQSERLQRIEAPGLGAILARDPAFLAEPVRQTVSVVFIDLSGFTGLSEAIGPAAVRDILSSFFEIIDEEVRRHGGAITSFMGDGAMILFGLPEPADDDAARAAACAVKLADRTRLFLAKDDALRRRRIGFKLGAHCGPIVASRLGGGDRQQITVAGDTVNVAQRLMEVAASRGAEFALSQELLQRAGQDAAPLRCGELEGPFEAKLRGRSRSVTAYAWHGGMI